MVSWVLAHVEIHISVLECEEPEVQVVQAPRLAIWRSQPTLVEASVDLKGCLRYGAQYLWQISSAPSCDYDEDHHNPSGLVTPASESVSLIQLPLEVDVQRLQLSLPKMVLAAGNYTLVFSLSYENVPLKKAACLQLSVMAARSVETPISTLIHHLGKVISADVKLFSCQANAHHRRGHLQSMVQDSGPAAQCRAVL